MTDSLDQVVVDLFPARGVADFAYAIVKQTFTEQHGRLHQVPGEELQLDLRDDSKIIYPGSDFRLTKQAADVVVLGSAFPERTGDREAEVSVTIGNRRVSLYVCGDRMLTVHPSGRAQITRPDPFEEIPLTYANAYGGIDARVPLGDLDVPPEVVLNSDHPGLYPRNPYGKGYVVLPDAAADIVMPNVERSDMRLTEGNVVAGDPRHWYRQPIPGLIGWAYAHLFPRYLCWGLDAWYSPPDDDSLPEVQRGWVPPNYRRHIPQHPLEAAASDYGPRFAQEAQPELTFSDLRAATPIDIRGMLPEGEPFRCVLPDPPQLEFVVGNSIEHVAPRITHVMISPGERKVEITYNAMLRNFPKHYAAGVSRNIPLSVRVNQGTPHQIPNPADSVGTDAGESAVRIEFVTL